MKTSLSVKERKVLDYIIRYAKNNWDHPTYREIMEHLKLRSLNSVTQFIFQLSKKGYLVLTPKKGYRISKTIIEKHK